MVVRLLSLIAVLAAGAAAAASSPKPLAGVPLTGTTGLQLLVANDPPVVLDLDTGHVTRIRGLDVRGNPVLSVLAVGKDAVVWLARRVPARRAPAAEIYVVRRGTTSATRLATAWDVAPAADGEAIWLKSYEDARHCTLRELGLDRRARRRPRPVPCSTRLVDLGAGALLFQGSSVVDPRTGRTLLRTSGVWAMAGNFAVTTGASRQALGLRDLRGGRRWRLPWPSRIAYRDQAAVQASGGLIALGFSDPAYQDGGTQVIDLWLLDPTARRFQHLPDMPAAVSLKFTSMSWTTGGRLVLLAETAGRDVVAVWRPGDDRIAVRRVRLPARRSGSDSFVVWDAAQSP